MMQLSGMQLGGGVSALRAQPARPRGAVSGASRGGSAGHVAHQRCSCATCGRKAAGLRARVRAAASGNDQQGADGKAMPMWQKVHLDSKPAAEAASKLVEPAAARDEAPAEPTVLNVEKGAAPLWQTKQKAETGAPLWQSVHVSQWQQEQDAAQVATAVSAPEQSSAPGAPPVEKAAAPLWQTVFEKDKKDESDPMWARVNSGREIKDGVATPVASAQTEAFPAPPADAGAAPAWQKVHEKKAEPTPWWKVQLGRGDAAVTTSVATPLSPPEAPSGPLPSPVEKGEAPKWQVAFEKKEEAPMWARVNSSRDTAAGVATPVSPAAAAPAAPAPAPVSAAEPLWQSVHGIKKEGGAAPAAPATSAAAVQFTSVAPVPVAAPAPVAAAQAAPAKPAEVPEAAPQAENGAVMVAARGFIALVLAASGAGFLGWFLP